MKFLLRIKTKGSGGYYATLSPFSPSETFWSMTSKKLTFLLGMKTTSCRGYYVTLMKFLPTETLWNITWKKVEVSASYENYIKWGISRNSSVNFCLLRYSGTWLQKGLKVLLGIKTTSSKTYYVPFRSIFGIFYILKHDGEKGSIFCLVWKLHQAGDIT